MIQPHSHNGKWIIVKSVPRRDPSSVGSRQRSRVSTVIVGIWSGTGWVSSGGLEFDTEPEAIAYRDKLLLLIKE